jgi:hypothetical protein
VRADLTALLNHCKDEWLPRVLDCLKDDKFILDINEQLQTALGLYIHVVTLERRLQLSIITSSANLSKVQ